MLQLPRSWLRRAVMTCHPHARLLTQVWRGRVCGGRAETAVRPAGSAEARRVAVRTYRACVQLTRTFTFKTHLRVRRLDAHLGATCTVGRRECGLVIYQFRELVP